MIGPYDTPQAFRAALEARLRNVARQQGTDLQRLQWRIAFERLLARLFAGDDPPWLLKGGYALELRLQDRARSTLDLDLSVPDPKRLVRSASGDEAGRIDTQIRFASRFSEEAVVIVLDPDVAAVFATSEAANDALRVPIDALRNLAEAPNLLEKVKGSSASAASSPS